MNPGIRNISPVAIAGLPTANIGARSMAQAICGWRPDVPRRGVVQWSDAGDTASYPGTGTTWQDSSGAGKSGTLTNGPTFTAENGGAIAFDGVNDYAAFPSLISFLPQYDLTPRTVVMWVNGTGTIISNERTNGALNYFRVFVDANAVTMEVGAYFSSPFSEFFRITTTSTPYASFANRWMMVSFSIDRGRNNWSVGVNQYFVDTSRAFTIGSFNSAFSNVDVGRFRNYLYGTAYGTCRVGAFAIYNRLLDKSEIVAFYGAYRGRYDV